MADVDESFLPETVAPVSAGVAAAARAKIDDPEALYQSLVRSLKRRKGFGIVFVQCTPAKGRELFSQLQKDLPQRQLGKLTLTEPIDNLLNVIAARDDIDQLKTLVIEGIEQSLLPYIQSEAGRNDYYKLEVLPPILDHLNRQRENFREALGHLCLVFVVPPFALKYFMYRAVDFFDWRSGIWTFAAEKEQLLQETKRALDGEYSEYSMFSEAERNEKIAALQNLIDEKDQSDEQRSQLLIEQSWVFDAAQDFETALRCCERAITLHDTNYKTWYAKGVALHDLGRCEEAIAAYDQALAINPDKHEALYNKGNALHKLGRYEEVIAAYDQAIAIKPDYHEALYNKGNALGEFGRYEEAIAAYDQAIAIKPDKYEALHNKGITLRKLGRYEEVIAAYDQAIAIKPNNHEALNNKGSALGELGRYEEAIAAFNQALAIKPDDQAALYNKGYALDELGRYEGV